MAKAKVTGRILPEGKGARRSASSLSSHALRHTFNSAMANAGVSQEVRQKLTGHASAEMNARYTHHEIENLKAAVAKVPGVTGVG
jgi:integrase